MYRIPHSLSWLINKKARLLGEINSARKNLNEYIAAEEERISSLEQDIRNLDGVFRLHEVRIDPQLISAKRTNNPKKHLPHGGYTKLILDSLKQSYPNPLGTDELTYLLIGFLDNPDLEFKALREIIKKRLQGLSRKKVVIPAHKGTKGWNVKGLWKLNPDGIPNPKKLVNGELATPFIPLPISTPPD
jgi:hypothetical protein